MTRKDFNGEVILKWVLFILGVYIIAGALKLGVGTIGEPGPGCFPLIGGAVILISDIFLLLEGRRDTERLFRSRNELKIFIIMAFAFSLWIIAMPLLGYVIITFLGTASISKVLKLEGWLKPLLLGVGTTLFIYLLFGYLFYIDLPKGFLS